MNPVLEALLKDRRGKKVKSGSKIEVLEFPHA
jgi:hypothetical protein